MNRGIHPNEGGFEGFAPDLPGISGKQGRLLDLECRSRCGRSGAEKQWEHSFYPRALRDNGVGERVGRRASRHVSGVPTRFPEKMTRSFVAHPLRAADDVGPGGGLCPYAGMEAFR